MSKIESEIVLSNIAAITWRIEEMVEAGADLEDAKVDAMRGYTFGPIASANRKAIFDAIDGLTVGDLRPSVGECVDSRLYEQALVAGSLPDTWSRRFRWVVWGSV